MFFSRGRGAGSYCVFPGLSSSGALESRPESNNGNLAFSQALIHIRQEGATQTNKHKHEQTPKHKHLNKDSNDMKQRHIML